MSTTRVEFQRILIGAGSYADAEAALRLATLLSEAPSLDLGGMLVEETDAAEAPFLPGQRVITTRGTMVMAPSQNQLRTLMESDAKAFRRMLSLVAQARAANWTFEQRKGDLIHRLCEAAQGWDILLLGYRDLHKRSGRVVLIDPPGEDGAVALANSLARRLGTEVLRLRLPEGGDAATSGEDELFSRIGRINASVVVLDLAAGPLHSHEQLRQLLNAARCPVVTLGAAQSVPALAHSTQIPPAPQA